MIELTQIRLRQGDRILFDADNLRIADGWHLGITGRNGTGKSSLFRLLLGQREVDSGELFISRDQRLACMAQEVPALAISALDYVQAGDERLIAAQAELAAAEQADDGHAIAHAHGLLDTLGYWTAEARAASLLAGLGFTVEQQRLPVADFSGGWRMRLNLARTLMAQADVLLLDEPTNHLDLDAILWLGDTLKRYPGTLLLVSHDRHFLDACVDHILHIENQHLTHYSGNYSSFERQRTEQLAQQQSAFEQQQRQRAHLQSYIDRFKAQATKARQAQSRIKALERLTLSAPAHVDSGFSFEIHAPSRLPNPLLTLDQVDCGYGDTTLLHQINLRIEASTRIGLLGANGAGKSTLIRTLAGLLPPLGGELIPAPDLAIGYFHQQQIDQLDMTASPFLTLQRAHPKWTELTVRKELGKFGFHGDRVFETIEGFSGGEKTRLALCLLVQHKPAILLLDEPTNHLDLDMREALALALQDFAGALVLISHDRALLETCVDDYLLVADGGIHIWEEDLDAYAKHLRELSTTTKTQSAKALAAADKAEQEKQAAREKESPEDARLKRQQAAQKREQLRPLKKQIEKLEKQLQDGSQTLADIEQQLADESLYQPDRKNELQQLLAAQANAQKQQASLEEQLLNAMEQLEQLEASL